MSKDTRKSAPQTQYLSLVVTHLNASTGPVLSVRALAWALRSGTAHAQDRDPAGSAAILSLFIEATPHQILSCINEAGAGIESADRLYQEALADNTPRAHAWEQATAHLR